MGVIVRLFWWALLSLLLVGVPTIEAAAAPVMACAPAGDKGHAVPMTCITCCVLPAEAPVLPMPRRVSVVTLVSAVAPMVGVEPKATSPPPRLLRLRPL